MDFFFAYQKHGLIFLPHIIFFIIETACVHLTIYISMILLVISTLMLPDKFGAAMAIVKSDIGGNITVRNLHFIVTY